MTEHTAVGKFLGGKEIVDVSSDSSFVNFYFEDGSYQTAPIVDSEVLVTFDEVEEASEITVTDAESNELNKEIVSTQVSTTGETELGFYKTIQPIPFTNEEGEEIGVTEIGSIQEVPVALGDFWVANGMAEKVDGPTIIEETE